MSSAKVVPAIAESMPKASPATDKVQISRRNCLRCSKLSTSQRITKQPSFKLHHLCIKLIVVSLLFASLGHNSWDLYTRFDASKKTVVEIQELVRKSSREIQNSLKSIEVKLMNQEERFHIQLKQVRRETGQLMEAMELVKHIEEKLSVNEKEKLSLDDVRAVAKHIVQEEMQKHCADGIGIIDYVLKAGGGMVVAHSEPYEAIEDQFLQFAKRPNIHPNIHPLASHVLEPTFGEPGRCLPLKGSSVYIVISLKTSIFPKAVSLEHVDQSVAYERSSSPKDFCIFGWHSKHKKAFISLDSSEVISLGEFRYNLQKNNVQTFPLSNPSQKKLVNMIRLDILSNHGSASYTCVYRLRVHGTAQP